jgi:hypothetical protein
MSAHNASELDRWINDCGYTYIKSPDTPESCTTVSIHGLNVIAGGADPHAVFGDDDTHVHHITGDPFIETPDTVTVLPVEDHHEIHSSGSDTPDLDEIIGGGVPK